MVKMKILIISKTLELIIPKEKYKINFTQTLIL